MQQSSVSLRSLDQGCVTFCTLLFTPSYNAAEFRSAHASSLLGKLSAINQDSAPAVWFEQTR